MSITDKPLKSSRFSSPPLHVVHPPCPSRMPTSSSPNSTTPSIHVADPQRYTLPLPDPLLVRLMAFQEVIPRGDFFRVVLPPSDDGAVTATMTQKQRDMVLGA